MYCAVCGQMVPNNVLPAHREQQLALMARSMEEALNVVLVVRRTKARGNQSSVAKQRKIARKNFKRATSPTRDANGEYTRPAYGSCRERFAHSPQWRVNMMAQGHTDESMQEMDELAVSDRQWKNLSRDEREHRYANRPMIASSQSGGANQQPVRAHPEYEALRAGFAGGDSSRNLKLHCPQGHSMQYYPTPSGGDCQMCNKYIQKHAECGYCGHCWPALWVCMKCAREDKRHRHPYSHY